jgi:hypothetical protein
MEGNSSLLIDTVMKSVEFRENLVILLFGVIGFALAKSWPDRVAHPELRSLRHLLPPIFLGSASLLLMLYQQRTLVSAITSDTFMSTAQNWINRGEPVLDILIALTAVTLLWGLRG